MITGLQGATRLTITIIIAVTVHLKFMLTSPPQVSAATIDDDSNIIDSSGYHSTPLTSTPSTSPLTSPTISASPVSSQDNDFTTQAALSLTRSTQTSNIVDSKAYYDVSFRTSTAGVIKFIRMSFPAGTYLGSALLVEATGIGPGTISAGAGGNTLAYTITNAINVPANTNIRIQIANANNPLSPSNSLTVSITTRNAANGIIDGPTATSAYNMVQVGNSQIAPDAVTTTKIANGHKTSNKPAESFIKKVTVLDDAAGNSVGWNPDGVQNGFAITEPLVSTPDTTLVIPSVLDSGVPRGSL